MKIIYPNIAICQSVSSEQDGAPGSYVTSNNHLHAKWMPESSDSSPSITLLCRDSGNSVMIDGIDADAISVEVRSPEGSTVTTASYDLVGSDSYYGTYQIPRVWLDYDVQAMSHTIIISLTKGSVASPGIGIVYAGRTYLSFRNPKWGLNGGPKDYSIEWDMDRGYRDVFKGNTLRTFGLSHDFYNQLEMFYAVRRRLTDIGRDPAAWCLHDMLEPRHEYLIYANMPDDFKWSMPKYGNNEISYNLKEFI